MTPLGSRGDRIGVLSEGRVADLALVQVEEAGEEAGEEAEDSMGVVRRLARRVVTRGVWREGEKVA